MDKQIFVYIVYDNDTNSILFTSEKKDSYEYEAKYIIMSNYFPSIQIMYNSNWLSLDSAFVLLESYCTLSGTGYKKLWKASPETDD